ncbi:MAG: hypothetical protein M1827_002007 [Pycnora praestabilis]|nr:MAG: hypothetical protein M1827_002007 [Pycnora praestabilis]
MTSRPHITNQPGSFEDYQLRGQFLTPGVKSTGQATQYFSSGTPQTMSQPSGMAGTGDRYGIPSQIPENPSYQQEPAKTQLQQQAQPLPAAYNPADYQHQPTGVMSTGPQQYEMTGASGYAGNQSAQQPFQGAPSGHQFEAPSQQLTTGGAYVPPPPPQRLSHNFGDDDPSSPIHYTRDPHKLIAYLVPFPKPQLHGVDPAAIPERFLIYTPPPPPIGAPTEGEKEGKIHKVQRKWQDEVREAKTSTAKTASWKGVKSKVTRGISKGMSLTKTSDLEFLNRITGDSKSEPHDHHADDGVEEGDTSHKTVGLEELVLIYPQSFGQSQEQVRTEFINTMFRSKSKAQKDAVIATGLLPVSAAIDILATLVWPFGGLLEIDSVWAYSSIRGAKTARSVTKRLTSSTQNANSSQSNDVVDGDTLRLAFTPSLRLETLRKYLAARCAERDHSLFPSSGVPPTETEVISAIGWEPTQSGGSTHNWEDEQWELTEVKDDLKSVMHKGAKEWDKWCKGFAKDPEKAMKK